MLYNLNTKPAKTSKQELAKELRRISRRMKMEGYVSMAKIIVKLAEIFVNDDKSQK